MIIVYLNLQNKNNQVLKNWFLEMADSIAIARVQKELKDFQKKGGDLVGIRLGNA